MCSAKEAAEKEAAAKQAAAKQAAAKQAAAKQARSTPALSAYHSPYSLIVKLRGEAKLKNTRNIFQDLGNREISSNTIRKDILFCFHKKKSFSLEDICIWSHMKSHDAFAKMSSRSFTSSINVSKIP